MILTIGPGGCGFTFLNWSLSWLRGDKTYRNLKNVEYPVVSNPLHNFYTAHAFKKDHIHNDSADISNAHDKSIIYFVPIDKQHFDYVASLPAKKIIFDPKNYQKEIFLRQLTTVETSIGQLEKFLFNHYDPEAVRSIILELSDQFICYYPTHVVAENSMYVSTADMFFNLDTAILNVCNFLSIDIDQTRWIEWCKVYAQYKQNNQKFFTKSLYADVDQKQRAQIIKEFILWKNGKHPLINKSTLVVV